MIHTIESFAGIQEAVKHLAKLWHRGLSKLKLATYFVQYVNDTGTDGLGN